MSENSHWEEHWASDFLEELQNCIESTEWSMNVSQNSRGPLLFNHSDDSEVSFTDSRERTGTVRVEYECSEQSEPAVEINKRGYSGESYASVQHGFEWLKHVLNRHSDKNE